MLLPWVIWNQHFATGEKVQPQLAGVHTCLSVHVLGIINEALE